MMGQGNPRVPVFYKRLFQWFCREGLYEELAGDLEESFLENVEVHGLKAARSIYRKEVMLMIRPSVLSSVKFSINDIMVINNIKMAFRHIWRDKQHAAIAMFGLSIGLMASFLIFQYVHFETHFESQHEKEHQRIFRVSRVNVSIETGEVQRQNADNFLALREGILDKVPDVVSATRVSGMDFHCGYEGQVYESNAAFFVDAAFFEIFNYEVLSGDPAKLDEPNQLFLSASFARSIFGSEDPVGKTMTYYFDDIRSSLVVAGVFADPPTNTHIRPEVLASMDRVIEDALLARWFGDLGYDQFKWRWSNFHTYVLANERTDPNVLKSQIDQVIKDYRGNRDLQAGRVNKLMLHPLEELHFIQGFRNQIGPTSNRQVLRILSTSATLILVLAWINYINLTSARSIRRAKETGVRKVLGAVKTQLVQQFLVETIIVNLMAVVVAVCWVWLLVPVFQETTGLDLIAEISTESLFFFTGIIFLGVMIAGLYPSLVLAGFKPTQILRGKFASSKRGKSIRSSLMLIQFTVVLILLSGVFVVRSQLRYMTQYDIGMETASVVTISSPPGFMRDSTFHSRFEAMARRVRQLPAVEAITKTTLVSGNNNWGGQSSALQNGGDLGTVFMFFNSIDDQFVPFHGLELIAGRNLSEDLPNDRNGALVNEMVATGYGLSAEEMIGRTLLFQGGRPAKKVVGVIRNFYPMGVKYTIEPMMFALTGTDERYYLNLQLGGPDRLSTLQELEDIYVSFFPGTPVEIELADSRLAEIFASDRRVELLLKFFSFVAIIIAALGIVGLTTFLINQKMKEVSIRKVLGASFTDITGRFSKEYIFIVLGASILGIPAAVYFTRNWLNNYQLRVNLDPLHFTYPVIILLLIIVLIIAIKTVKAATANPGTMLRNE